MSAWTLGRRVTMLTLGVCVVSMVVSCRRAPVEEAASAPPSYTQAVSTIKSHRDAIRDAFTSDDPEAAHDELHEIGHLLETMPASIDASTLSSANKEQAKQAADKLFDAYTTLDGGLHGGEEVKYEDLADEIDVNVAILDDFVHLAEPGASSAPALVPPQVSDHDHDLDDDHDHE